MEKFYLKPSQVGPEWIDLCGLDLMVGFEYVNTALVLDGTTTFSALHAALGAVVDRNPALACRLQKNGVIISLDPDGPGVLLTHVESDGTLPEVGEHAFPAVDEIFFNPVPRVNRTPITEWPLLTIKVTTFADGRHLIGIRHNHAFADGMSFYLLITAWSESLAKPGELAFDFDRSRIADKRQLQSHLPSASSGILWAGRPGHEPPPAPRFFNTQFGVLNIDPDEYEELEMLVRRHESSFSMNDLLQAMLFKVYALTSGQGDHEAAIANLSYDVRRIGGAGVPLNYFGNGLLFRLLTMNFGELRTGSLIGIAQRFHDIARPHGNDMERDISFYQSQYEIGAYDEVGVFTAFPPILSNGGFYINNMLYRSRRPFDFGGALLAGGMVLSQPFDLRMAMLLRSAQGELTIKLSLEEQQLEAFINQWYVLMSRLMSNGLQ